MRSARRTGQGGRGLRFAVGLVVGAAWACTPAVRAQAPEPDAAPSSSVLPTPRVPAAGQPGPLFGSSPAGSSDESPGISSPLRFLLSPFLPSGSGNGGRGQPGLPPRSGRPRPGSIFDPGAAGPGISQGKGENFLDGALDSRTGWPFVFLDHFQPRPERVERFWVVQTRACPQEMGTDPWPRLKVLHFNAHGELAERHPDELFAQLAGRVVLVQVQGSLTTPDTALGGMLWTRSWLERNKALQDGAVVIAFDWPSQRIYRSDVKDINEKGRRAYVAAYHLARFLQAFPAGSRVCLLGQSYGGRVVPSALHLLGGGELNSQDRDPPVRLPTLRPDIRVRAVVIAGASDHDWLDPDKRLGRALHGCEGLLNLYNRKDEALRLYPFLLRSGHRRALGRVGLDNRDFARLGPIASRYAEHDVHEVLGREHTLLDAVANPQIAHRIAPYLWNPNPAPAPTQENAEPAGLEDRKANRTRPE